MMKKAIKDKLLSDRGMTLVEVLVAMSILMIIIFTFTPLFAQYYRNIYTAGEVNKNTYEKASLIERVLANKGGHTDTYETRVSDVPLTLSVKNAGGTNVNMTYTNKSGVSQNADASILFKSGNDDGYEVTGISVVSNYLASDPRSAQNNYETFYADSEGAGLVCFPNTITDDFIEKQIVLVLTGGDEDKFESIKDVEKNLKVYYTNSLGNKVLIPFAEDGLYSVDSIEDNGTAVVLTLKGGNGTICFQNSPLIFEYKYYAPLSVDIGAPEIMLVGEKASDGGYWYYATSGVDTETGEMDLIAKKTTTSTDTSSGLSAAMNDVEWVAKGKGDDGNGGVNSYGYYIMGGDAGEIHRFWKNPTTGNYYWGGDNVVNYNRYGYYNDDGSNAGGFENMTKALTTKVSFKNIFRSNQTAVSYNGVSDANMISYSDKTSVFGTWKTITTNYFTANVTNDDYNHYFLTLGGVAKIKTWTGSKYKYYGSDTHAEQDENNSMHSWVTGGNSFAGNLNATGYKAATNYEYSGDNSLVTITSVGAVQINSSGANYSAASQASNIYNGNLYPTSSYTLYCGYIPAVMDMWGFIVGSSSYYIHIATIGAAYSTTNNSWYPVGKFGDIHTTSTTLSGSVFPNLSWRKLLNYWQDGDTNCDSVFPYPGNNKKSFYNVAGGTGDAYIGLALPAQGNDYYISSGKEVDVTTGYLSQPYAISVNNPTYASIKGLTGSDYYFYDYNNASGKFDHSFFSSGLRDFVTLLDVKSYHDDITDNNFSLAVGYTLSFINSDYAWSTRLSQVYNTGIVYIRATGAGDENDEQNSMASGKGWSLKKETNVFHQFYGTDQYQNSSGIQTALGWNTEYHRSYFNISGSSTKAPQSGYSPSLTEGSSSYGTNTHPMAQTECTCVNWGTTWDDKPQAMWGTENGTLLSWFYDYENLTASKITSVAKEFESYMWADRIGATSPLRNDGNKKQFYDYWSVKNGNSDTYGFVSVLKSVEDVAFGGDYWVAVGTQSGKAPSSYCASSSCYSGSGAAASYVNVRYCCDQDNGYMAWKAVKIADQNNINIVSVTFCQNIWYATGYIDSDSDGVYDVGEEGVIYYATDPLYSSAEKFGGWAKCKTRVSADSDEYSSAHTYAVYYSDTGTKGSMTLQGVNSMSSQG